MDGGFIPEKIRAQLSGEPVLILDDFFAEMRVLLGELRMRTKQAFMVECKDVLAAKELEAELADAQAEVKRLKEDDKINRHMLAELHDTTVPEEMYIPLRDFCAGVKAGKKGGLKELRDKVGYLAEYTVIGITVNAEKVHGMLRDALAQLEPETEEDGK